MTNQGELDRELLAQDAAISLAELEEAKAHERVKQLKYNKSKFLLEIQSEFIRLRSEQLKKEEPKAEPKKE